MLRPPANKTPESTSARNDMYLAVDEFLIRFITRNDIVFVMKPHTNIGNRNIFYMFAMFEYITIL